MNNVLRDWRSGCFGVWLEGEQGVGGADGMKNDGTVATDEMIATYNTRFGISPGVPAHDGSINCAKAPPNGFAKLMTAVAATLPRLVNHKSEYLVGAERTKGCANPVNI